MKVLKFANLFNAIASVVGVVTGIITVLLTYENHPRLAMISAILMILLAGTFLLFPKIRNYSAIRRGVKAIQAKLMASNINPDCLISFNRTGAVFAGMLAVNLGVQELISICKIRRESNQPSTQGKYSYSLTSAVTCDRTALNEYKGICVVFYVIDTARSLQQGLEYLSRLGLDLNKIQIVTMFITSGARHRYPNILYVTEIPDARGELRRLPWLTGEYHYL